ncbi:M14 family metallopeptidase [Flavobacterium sp. ACAM 123]|jgi:hypothetical protein|uniref:M14 family metallopeptidase n=1 Tax=Flavobacterium sp. ACAM 123 TaxID=1189620 RepID=UPI0002E83DD2|nr:M14 family metallopeptidase [Flavobacterium sp. ACAM 123]
MRRAYYQIFSSIITIVFVAGCASVKPVPFKTAVDTTLKHIDFQSKQTYHLDDLGIYASNEFDGARLNSFVKKNDSTALVLVQPENMPINNSPYYAFKTWSDAPRSFYFEFKYPKGFKHRYISKLKINNKWTVIDSSFVFKKDSIITIKLNLSKAPITVAAQEIQSSIDVKNWYSEIVKGKEDFVKVRSAGKSVLGKNLPVLDLYSGSKKNKEIIILLTRQHPPEVTGYYAFQSFLSTILADNDLSKSFLSKYRVLAFPILNPDGVDLGHWRHNAAGVDLNRDWSVYNQPEIRQITRFIERNKKGRIILGLDFHSTWHDVFYTNKAREGTTLPGFIDDWFASLERNIPNYKVNEESGNSAKPVSKGWFLQGHNAVGITYEIGDATPKESIALFGRISAEQMMTILMTK